MRILIFTLTVVLLSGSSVAGDATSETKNFLNEAPVEVYTDNPSYICLHMRINYTPTDNQQKLVVREALIKSNDAVASPGDPEASEVNVVPRVVEATKGIMEDSEMKEDLGAESPMSNRAMGTGIISFPKPPSNSQSKKGSSIG